MTSQGRIRRNIHTYPFKYHHVQPESFFELDTAAIYLHIPYCVTKCHFCDYVVYTNTPEDKRLAYVDALCREIARFPEIGVFPRFRIDAIYFGGGTPGLLPAEQLIRLLDQMRESFQLAEDCEICVEFDPGSVQRDKLQAIFDAGVTRLSMGVQCFDEELLEKNNRPHRLQDCYDAWETVVNTGFQHTNIDLLYPLIGLDLDSWRHSLSEAIRLAPSCITAYPLEVWPKTAYHHWITKGKHQLPEIEAEMEMCRLAFDMLEEAGYQRLSTSGYYHPQRYPRYCRFLDYYWKTWPMIGFGVSSKSVIYDWLYTNIRSQAEYVRRIDEGQPVVDFGIRLTKPAEMRRVMIRGLKMCEVLKGEFLERFGVPMDTVFGKEIDQLVRDGLLRNDPDRIELTREGQIYSTNVYETFYTEEDLRDPDESKGELQFGISDLIVP